MPEEKNINRRQFFTNSSKLIAASSLLPLHTSFAQDNGASPGKRLKVALVGTGSRGTSAWGKDLVASYKDYVDMVGLCDINSKRLEWAKNYIGTNALLYHARDFDRMIKETSPDAVIITTPDCFHEEYIVRTLELGCDVISEKPIATEAEQCQRILDAEIRTGRKVRTTFNVRHMEMAENIKEIVASGELGNIISVDFQEFLDCSHGASYFRRWHGKSRYSGTLLLSKACHHFDQVNWTLDAEPEEVHAYGKLAFYGKNNSFRYKHCRGCPFKKKCHFWWDILSDKLSAEMYVNCEDEDGYIRDGCVWSLDNDTYDTNTVEVKYKNGTLMSYTLNAYLPYEGQRISFSGEKGRLDVRIYYSQGWEVSHEVEFRLSTFFGETWKSKGNTRVWHLSRLKGGHGGADEKLKDMYFKPNQSDPLGKMAGSRAAVLSSLVGIAARKSIESGQRVKIADLVDFHQKWGE